jgi:hypothetical protein
MSFSVQQAEYSHVRLRRRWPPITVDKNSGDVCSVGEAVEQSRKTCGDACAGSYDLLVRGSCCSADERISESCGLLAAQGN